MNTGFCRWHIERHSGHDRCSLIVKHMEVFLHAGIPSHIRIAARIIMERYRRRETMLFANNAEHTIPRANPISSPGESRCPAAFSFRSGLRSSSVLAELCMRYNPCAQSDVKVLDLNWTDSLRTYG